MDQLQLKATAARLTDIRADMLKRQPFFGRLLLRLSFGFADCGTAYTDMRRIVFDPSFAARLDESQLSFLLMHELMHCVLKHCTRGSGKLPLLYNIACDIVVNSIILEALGMDEMLLDGSPAMHLAPDGEEGRNYSAEEVYQMLLHQPDEERSKLGSDGLFDSHAIWKEIFSDSILEETWDQHTASAARSAGFGSGIPEGIKRIVKEIERTPRINWRQVLHDFIRHDRSDYCFTPPDRRFSDAFILPAFQENANGAAVDRIWFVVDTSGSVGDATLATVLREIESAVEQVEHMSGYLSFFDCDVTEPVPFATQEELSSVEPVGGGGTSFAKIFESMKEYYRDELPAAVIILTDGYARFPAEETALDVPVFWIIVDSEVKPPWGEYVRLHTDTEET